MKKTILLFALISISTLSFAQKQRFYTEDVTYKKDGVKKDLKQGFFVEVDERKGYVKVYEKGKDEYIEYKLLEKDNKRSFIDTKGDLEAVAYNVITSFDNHYGSNFYIAKQYSTGSIGAIQYEVADNNTGWWYHNLVPVLEEEETQQPKTKEKVASSGTGFAISSNGYIATNYHVVEGAISIVVKGIDGDFSKRLSAEVVKIDERNDLAIIKIKDTRFTSLGIVPYTFRQGLANAGENVFVLGYPLTSSMGEEIKLTNGIISSKTGFQDDVSTYQISAPVQPGNSGGPLFDVNGNLLGIVSSKHTKAENAGYAIKNSYLKTMIDLLPQPVNFQTTNLLNGKPLTEQVKLASKFTYLIIVNDNSTSETMAQFSSENSGIKAAEFYSAKSDEEKENGQYKAALSYLNLAIEKAPEYTALYGKRGAVYLKLEEYTKSIKDWSVVISRLPVYSLAYIFRGIAKIKLGNTSSGCADLLKAKELGDTDAEDYLKMYCK